MNIDSELQNIKTYLKKHWIKANELINEYQNNSSKTNAIIAKLKIQGLKMMATGFTFYICSGSKKLGQTDSYADEILNNLAQQLDIKDIDIKLLFGLCLKEQLINNQMLNSISKVINQDDLQKTMTKTKSNSAPSQIQISASEGESDEEYSISTSTQPNFYAIMKKSDSKMQDFQDDFDDICISHLDNSECNFNNDYIQNQNQEIREYLYKLTHSTTQLSYLCQRMKWPQPTFIEDKSKISEVLYSCKTEVTVRALGKQKFWTFTTECLGAISKKQAKRIASLLVLRKIYNRLPQIWQKFEKLKKQNPGIQQLLTSNNEQIFKKLVKNEVKNLGTLQVFKQEKKPQQTPQIIQINKYLDNVKSYKAQMNILIGKQKKISPPEVIREKQDQLSLWPVKIIIFDDKVQLEAEERDASKKGAQQKCTRDLLFQLYTRNIPRWKSFVAYKKDKKLQ